MCVLLTCKHCKHKLSEVATPLPVNDPNSAPRKIIAELMILRSILSKGRQDAGDAQERARGLEIRCISFEEHLHSHPKKINK